MAKMKANIGDFVYSQISQKWLCGLKSIHPVFGEPNNEGGILYVTEEHVEQG
jgi:SSS family solute:Na+ symporter